MGNTLRFRDFNGEMNFFVRFWMQNNFRMIVLARAVRGRKIFMPEGNGKEVFLVWEQFGERLV